MANLKGVGFPYIEYLQHTASSQNPQWIHNILKSFELLGKFGRHNTPFVYSICESPSWKWVTFVKLKVLFKEKSFACIFFFIELEKLINGYQKGIEIE